MDEFLKQILNSAIPINESIRSSDFKSSAKQLKLRIIDLFRFTSIQLSPSFLTVVLGYIDENAQSQDKKKRYASAVALSAIIDLYPFDLHVLQYTPIVNRLLKPGYKPLVQVGAILAGRIARIVGKNRDEFLRQLVLSSQRQLDTSPNPDERYLAASIWHELAMVAPEVLYQVGTSFATTISTSLLRNDPLVNELITHTVELLFVSETAVLGLSFLTEIHNILIFTTLKNFGEVQSTGEIIGTIQLLITLLRLKPPISEKSAKTLVLPRCIELVSNSNMEISFSAIETIFQMKRTGVIDVDQTTYSLIYDSLFKWAMRYPQESLPIIQEMITTFRKFNLRSCQALTQSMNNILNYLPANIGPQFAFEITVTIIENFPQQNANISIFVTNVKNILQRSSIPLPIYRLLEALNKTMPSWHISFTIFKKEVLQIIRQELNHPSNLTDRVVIVLLALTEFPEIDVQEAIELSGFVEKLMVSKDIEVRKLVVGATVHLFKASTKKLPLKLMIRMVKFALNEQSRAVRLSSIEAFTPETYPYISQQEVFPIFCRFVNDEVAEIRQYALKVITQLPAVNFTITRNILLSSLKQMNPNLSVILPSTLPVWIVFPNVIKAAAPFIHIYAYGLFQKLHEMLTRRFTPYKDQTLIFANSTILREVDTCLVTSITTLYLICPKIVPLEPIISILKSMFEQPVHPWTKISGMSALKKIVESGVRFETNLMSTLLRIIEKNDNLKLTISTLKVIGTLGVSKIVAPRKKRQVIFRSLLINPRFFKQYYLDKMFEYMSEVFHTINVLSVQEKTVSCICTIFHTEPSIIPEHLETILDDLLPFIREMKNERVSVFLEYLQKIITDSGHLILSRSSDIFETVKDYFMGDYTKEACGTLSSVVVATTGQCDVILNQIISNVFLLLKSRKDVEKFDIQIFALLQTILQYSSAYRPTISTGIIDLLMTPGTAGCIQERCLDTIEFIIFNVSSENVMSPLRRCLEMVATRSQLRWRDRALQILASMNDGFTSQITESYVYQPIVKPVDKAKMNFEQFMAAIGALVHKGVPNPSKKTIKKWFEDFLDFLIQYSPLTVIKALDVLQIKPKFAFKLSFLAAWISFDEDQRKKISKKLNKILALPEIPDDIVLQFLRLAEIGILSQIDLGFDIKLLVDKCIKIKRYELAWSFIESIPLIRNEDIPELYIENLTIANQILGRKEEAKTIATRIKDANFSTYMLLGDWTKALNIINGMEQPERYITQKIECLAAVESWQDIIKLEDSFDAQSLADQAHIAHYFYTAEMYCGNKDKALVFVDKTGGYQIEDCIDKAILFISLKDYEKAKKEIRKGWKYLSSSMSSINRNHRLTVARHLFHAEELHQLSEVIRVFKDPQYVEKYRLKWSTKISLVHKEYEKERKLFRIMSLAPEATSINDFALHILSGTIEDKEIEEEMRLASLFFPDKESQGYRFAELFLTKGEKRLESCLKQLDTFDGEFKRKLQNLIGKDMFLASKSIDDLKQAEQFLTDASINYDKITEILLLLTNITGNEDKALKAVRAINKRILNKTKSRLFYLYHLLSLLVKFSDSEKVCKAIADMVLSVDPKILIPIIGNIFQLITHKSKYVVDTVVKIVIHLMPAMKEGFFFDLYRESLKGEDNRMLDDILNEVQRVHTILYSQVSLISQKLIEISNNLWGFYTTELNTLIETRDFHCIEKMNAAYNNPDLSHMEQDFKKYFGEKAEAFMNNALEKGKIEDSDIEAATKLLSTIRKRQDAILVIPLNSMNEQLDRKTTWQITIPGERATRNGVKLVKFNHSVKNLVNGFLISMSGSDGKNYSFFLRKWSQKKLPQHQRFIKLLREISPSIGKLQQRNNILLSDDVILRERLKGFVPIFNYISWYSQSLSNSNSTDEIKTKTIEEMIKSDENKDQLARALLVSSRNAMDWSIRQQNFSRTTGVVSALSYIVGKLDSGLSALLIDKVTGCIDCSSYEVTPDSQPVPFRLTKNIVSAFGTAGIDGTFRTQLIKTLKEIRYYKRGIAPCIQFHIKDIPFNDPKVPTEYLSSFVPDFKGDEELDKVYARIKGRENTEEEVDSLIKQATNEENIAKMPESWLPWW